MRNHRIFQILKSKTNFFFFFPQVLSPQPGRKLVTKMLPSPLRRLPERRLALPQTRPRPEPGTNTAAPGPRSPQAPGRARAAPCLRKPHPGALKAPRWATGPGPAAALRPWAMGCLRRPGRCRPTHRAPGPGPPAAASPGHGRRRNRSVPGRSPELRPSLPRRVAQEGGWPGRQSSWLQKVFNALR